MLWHRMRGLNRTYYGVLVVVVSGLYWLYLLVLEFLLQPAGGYTYERYVTYNLAALCAVLVRALQNDSTKGQELIRSDFYSNHRSALRVTSAAGAGILLVLVATKDPRMSRIFFFSFLPLLYIVLFLCHRFIPTILVRSFFSNGHLQKALLVGPLEKVERLANWSNEMMHLGLETSCYLHSGEREGPCSLNATGLTTLERVVRREGITQVVLLELPASLQNLSEIVATCNRLGSRLLLVNNLPELFQRRISHFNLSGLDLITVMEEPLEDPLNRLMKRAMDIMISALVVALVLPPLTLLVAIVQSWQSPGPVFYWQTRSGRGSKPFRIIKFRSMAATNNSPAQQATKDDRRVYEFGRWLRKTSIDEIPQFINVLRGEMSVVGPRPHMIVHNRRFAEIMASYKVRAFVKPGITGIAQVSGYRGEARTDGEILERVKLDIAYVENWSLWRDMAIIVKTALQMVVPRDTAY
jgi:undecaprenyl-phosphate glucose phosphotransferase